MDMILQVMVCFSSASAFIAISIPATAVFHCCHLEYISKGKNTGVSFNVVSQ